MADVKLGWEDIPEEPYYSVVTRARLASFIEARNPRRWRRLQKDYKWLFDEMKSMGLNPEDARFLL